MRQQLTLLFLLLGICVSRAQECPVITYPADGDTDIPVDATITWPAATGAINGYLISLGTTPGGTDILDRQATVIDTFYTPPLGLPENRLIYVTISILLFNATPKECGGTTFTTTDVTTPPPCTLLIGPDDNAADVTVVTDISWGYAPTATSYVLSIGTSEGGTEILNETNIGNVLSYDPPGDLPQDTRIYVTIRPENENGGAASCVTESFFTGPIDDPCEEIDPISGTVTSLRPILEFPSLFIKCKDSDPIIMAPEGEADGYRWFRVENGNETFLSDSNIIEIDHFGNYVLEAYNVINKSGINIECKNSKNFNVVPSEPAIIESINTRNLTVGKQVTVNVSGTGDYEFSIDDENGPYQEDPIFINVSDGPHTIYVRDRNGCGTVSRLIERGVLPEDFPNFFTPNGDGVNDFWQFIKPTEVTDIDEVLFGKIAIFDRYGSLLIQLDPKSKGWDGSFRGTDLPSTDYWFKAFSLDQKEITGHFTLKR